MGRMAEMQAVGMKMRRVGSRGKMDVKVTLLRAIAAQKHHWMLSLWPKLQCFQLTQSPL